MYFRCLVLNNSIETRVKSCWLRFVPSERVGLAEQLKSVNRLYLVIGAEVQNKVSFLTAVAVDWIGLDGYLAWVWEVQSSIEYVEEAEVEILSITWNLYLHNDMYCWFWGCILYTNLCLTIWICIFRSYGLPERFWLWQECLIPQHEEDYLLWDVPKALLMSYRNRPILATTLISEVVLVKATVLQHCVVNTEIHSPDLKAFCKRADRIPSTILHERVNKLLQNGW